MSEPFIAEIRMAGFNFAPRNWAFCNGQLLSIAQNTALFSLLGTTYGGNRQTTFGLPNLQGSAPMHQGTGPGLSPRSLGEVGGTPNVTLAANEMPAHTHAYMGEQAQATSTSPTNNFLASNRNVNAYTPTGTAGIATGAMAGAALGNAGGSLPHNNLQPFLAVTFIICMFGVFPSRN